MQAIVLLEKVFGGEDLLARLALPDLLLALSCRAVAAAAVAVAVAVVLLHMS